MKNLIQIENEKKSLSLLDRLAYKGNNVSFNGKSLLSKTLVNCSKEGHKISAIVCGHLIQGPSKEDILSSEEIGFLTKKYLRPNIEWFFVLA